MADNTPTPAAIAAAKAILRDNDFVNVTGVGNVGVYEMAELIDTTLAAERARTKTLVDAVKSTKHYTAPDGDCWCEYPYFTDDKPHRSYCKNIRNALSAVEATK